MSLTIHQIIADLKRLSGRLQVHDESADAILSQGQTVAKQVDAMKHYADDINTLNESSGQSGSRGEIISELQHESRQLRELQAENRDLKLTLQDYQNAVDLIMTKYRYHTSELIKSTSVDLKSAYDDHRNEIIQKQAEKINEMAAVMSCAANFADEKEAEREEIITRLRIENQGLRELLAISQHYGSLNVFKENEKNEKLAEASSASSEPN